MSLSDLFCYFKQVPINVDNRNSHCDNTMLEEEGTHEFGTCM
jgi:hypothetical protein